LQLPLPSQVSAPSQTVLFPQAVPEATKVLPHFPAEQISFVHGLPSAQSAFPVH
jgi:hypothetical protein